MLGVTEDVQGSYKELKLLKKAYSCIKNTIPHEDWMSGNDYHYDYMVNISYQWDPLNHHDYLHWWKYDGPEAWRAGCHFSDTIRRCLQPIMEQKIDLNKYYLIIPGIEVTFSLFYLTLCEHQEMLANNAVCIHNRMLSDDVLSCSGVIAWMTGNMYPYLNRQLGPGPNKIVFASTRKVCIAVYQCIYTRGQWKRACGKHVDKTISKIVKKFTLLMAKYRSFGEHDLITNNIICDKCKKGSNLRTFKKLDNMRYDLLFNLLYGNQSPELFKECQLVDYPLNHCHIKNIWRRDLFNMFCHKVTNIMAPQLEPHLPLCDLGKWMESAERICNMGYDTMMDIASHIEHCTDGKDELFPCYKGLYIDQMMSWGLITASRLWFISHGYNLGATYRDIYPRIKQCSKLVYDHLSRTCRYGPPVVQLIQDLRTVLSISQSDINSGGMIWQDEHQLMIRNKQYLLQC